MTITERTHQQILTGIAIATRDVVAARSATKGQRGYVDFEMAVTLLDNCHAAIEPVREQSVISHTLQNADIELAMWGAGDAAPAVRRARQMIVGILAHLDD
jgi:hypothetical protein